MIVTMLLLVSGCKRVPEPTELPEKTLADLEAVTEDFDMEELNELNHGEVQVYYDAVTGKLRQIDGKFSTKRILTKEDALLALMSVRSLMGITAYDYSCEAIDDERNELCVYFFRQLYEGVPVEDGYFRVAAAKDGEPVSVSGAFQEVAAVDKEPSVSYRDGQKMFSRSFGSKIESVQLVVYKEEEETHLCWKYLVSAGNLPESRNIYVDANTGKMVYESTNVVEISHK